MKVKEYSLKFFKLLKYAYSIVSKSRDEMSKFMTGVSKEECREDMLNDKMDRGRLMVHTQ